MKSVRLFDFILFHDQPWQVIEHNGAELTLKSVTGDQEIHVGIAEILSQDSFQNEIPAPRPPLGQVNILESLDDSTRQRTEILHRHVVEVLTGHFPSENSDSAARVEYDPSLTLDERLTSKVAELASTDMAMSRRTLQRHISAYRSQGLSGLVDRRKTREYSPTGRADPQLVELLSKILNDELAQGIVVKSRIIDQAEHQRRLDGLNVPSRATMYRILSSIESPRAVFRNSSSAIKNRKLKRQQEDLINAERPGEYVEFGSTLLNVLVNDVAGNLCPARLTFAIDRATHLMCAAIIHTGPAHEVPASLLLARCVTPMSTQPGWNLVRAFTDSVMPSLFLNKASEDDSPRISDPFFIPETLVIDRAVSDIDSIFTAACERMQISLFLTKTQTPLFSSMIANIGKVIAAKFEQFLEKNLNPYLVDNLGDPYVWNIELLQRIFDQWQTKYWQFDAHAGLRHAVMPTRDLSPREMYSTLQSVAPIIETGITSEDYLEMLPMAWRRVNLYGIDLGKIVYYSDSLNPYLAVDSRLPDPAKGRWEVRYDPFRKRAIWMRDHSDNCWIECPMAVQSKASTPFSFSIISNIEQSISNR